MPVCRFVIMRSGIRGGLIPLALVLAGCASIRAALPDRAPTVSKPTSIVPAAAPVAPPPATVQTLTLASPDGARGRLTLIKTISYVRKAEGDPKNPAKPDAAYATVTAYSGSGSISVSDDLGRWTFSYAPVAVDEAAPQIQALGVRLQSASRDTVEIDWDESALVDPAGNRHRVVHRGDVTPGSTAAVWVGDAGLESLPQGQAVSIVLTVRRGDQRSLEKFVFESRPPEVAAPPAPRPISKWVGERFVVLPRPPSRQRDAYEALEVRDKIGRHPTPEDMAGAVLRVTSVRYDRVTPIVTFVREDTTQEYVGRAGAGSLEGLAPLADIEAARKEWRGKTLWLATPDLETLGEGSEDSRILPVKRLARVDIVDVEPGWSSNAPIRFILRTAGGSLGFRDVHTTGTNVPDAQRQRHGFDRAFLTQDPRTEFDWSGEVWMAIEDSRVLVGMTTAQARMSWGEPRRVERVISGSGSEERWSYADRRALVLVDGLVTEVLP